MSRPSLFGVRFAGVGSAVPEGVLTNADLEKLVDTSDEWIVQRTGIRERRKVDPEKEGTYELTVRALTNALDDAGLKGSDLDLVIVASVTSEMTCPSTACRVADAVGATPAGAFDLVAACCGFVYALNTAEALLRTGHYRTIGIIGCDTMTTVMDYDDRTVSVLFGDAAGAAILQRDEDATSGCLYQTLQADGHMWPSLYMPRRSEDIPESDIDNPIRLGCLRMNGREIYRFAVSKFREVIRDALDATGLQVDQISQFICHQSNIRIIDAAKDKLHLPEDRVYINIDKFGNTSAGSVGLCFDQLWRAGKIKPGEYILFVAFGGGLTWAVSIWKA
jgi:3-oxoacyl-[acyl-carrier-protein] synthase-3